MSEATISLINTKSLVALLGTRDQHLRMIRQELGVKVVVQDGEIRIEGDAEAVAQATAVLERLKHLADRPNGVSQQEVGELLNSAMKGKPAYEIPTLDVFHAKRKIQPQTAGQIRYVNAMLHNDLVFCIGPAGTGKTYLAVAMAVQALKTELVRKIVLVRPAVEAGEKLGYLPGDLQAKINPYLRPLLDALGEMMDYDQIKRFTEQDLIEMIPLAYMRGRTLNDAFIILDEGQNTTTAQMKMFLTRMGTGSKIVCSGDVTQVDLPPNIQSGLQDAVERLQGIRSVADVRLTGSDVVRHRLVQDIVEAYEQQPKRRQGK